MKNLKLKVLRWPYNVVLLKLYSRFQQYKANEDRIILRDGLLLRKCYGEIGSLINCQILLSKLLVKKVLRSMYGEFGKHPGTTTTNIAYREKLCYLNTAQLNRKWVLSCEQCTMESNIDNQTNHPPVKDSCAHVTGLDNAIQVDLVPKQISVRWLWKLCYSQGCFPQRIVCLACNKSKCWNDCQSQI